MLLCVASAGRWSHNKLVSRVKRGEAVDDEEEGGSGGLAIPAATKARFRADEPAIEIELETDRVVESVNNEMAMGMASNTERRTMSKRGQGVRTTKAKGEGGGDGRKDLGGGTRGRKGRVYVG